MLSESIGLALDISINALRVEGDNQNDKLHELHQISIHALRVEGDLATPIETPLPPAISIHALRVEGDHLFSDCSLSIRISIHALRVEGDLETCRSTFKISNFYPRPPGGGRPAAPVPAASQNR